MRVTSATMERTRQRILDAAAALFISRGFAATTTREIAAAARIATGTLFNYFPSKEALAMTLIGDAVSDARQQWLAGGRVPEEPSEALFAHVAAELRALRPFRPFLAEVLDAAASPFGGTPGDEGAFRDGHLDTVVTLLSDDPTGPPSFTTLHLYWTLYLGVLAFWTGDDSPNQENTLGVLDQSMRLFVHSLHDRPPREDSHVTDDR